MLYFVAIRAYNYRLVGLSKSVGVHCTVVGRA